MDVRLPHRVVYKVGEIVPAEEVIGTLQANQLLTSELGQMLERLFPGLIVEGKAGSQNYRDRQPPRVFLPGFRCDVPRGSEGGSPSVA